MAEYCLIPLTGKYGEGKFTRVSPEDYDLVVPFRWYCTHQGYVLASVSARPQLMHRFIMGNPKGMMVDHVDGDPNNNCRQNLRVCTARENSRNRKPLQGKKHKGAFLSKHMANLGYKPWGTAVYVDGRRFHLGWFETELEALQVYNLAAVKVMGEFARLNDVPLGDVEELRKKSRLDLL